MKSYFTLAIYSRIISGFKQIVRIWFNDSRFLCSDIFAAVYFGCEASHASIYGSIY